MYTAEDVATLKRAKASGALKVRFADGRETMFRSLKELDQIIADIEAELAGHSRIRRSVTRFASGL